MFDLSMERALTLADEFFPHAPEKIVQQYGIDVRRSRLNCDGWCLQLEGRAIIRINNDAPAARQRFTLAHELCHLILGIPAVVGESVFIVDKKRSVQEREVNKLAAKILLPLQEFVTI
jgi:Zn-dependent peptidase ImmA (M78 family)